MWFQYSALKIKYGTTGAGQVSFRDQLDAKKEKALQYVGGVVLSGIPGAMASSVNPGTMDEGGGKLFQLAKIFSLYCTLFIPSFRLYAKLSFCMRLHDVLKIKLIEICINLLLFSVTVS